MTVLILTSLLALLIQVLPMQTLESLFLFLPSVLSVRARHKIFRLATIMPCTLHIGALARFLTHPLAQGTDVESN